MLQTNHITEPLNSQTGKEKILELTTGIQGSRVIDDMVVYVGFVDVSGNNKSVFAFRPSHRCFIANLICFLRCDFSGLEGLANLIGYDIVLLLSAGGVLILPFGKKEFFIDSLRIALIGTDKFAVIGFRCVLRVVCSISQTLSDRFTLIHMERNQSCCCHSHHILSKRKSHLSVTSLRLFSILRAQELSKTFTCGLSLNSQEHNTKQGEECCQTHDCEDCQRSPHCLNDTIDTAADEDQEQQPDNMRGNIGKQIAQDANAFHNQQHRECKYLQNHLHRNISFLSNYIVHPLAKTLNDVAGYIKPQPKLRLPARLPEITGLMLT